MLPTVFAFALYALSMPASAHSSSSSAPDCVSKCWLNSQYVSTCTGNTQCLCDDANFQNSVYQCLYSQCATSKFGTALHHALGYCAGHEASPVSPDPSAESPMPTSIPQPALLRQQEGLKRRAGATRSASVSHSHSVTRSARPSVSASAYMTYGAQRAVVTGHPHHAPGPAMVLKLSNSKPKVPANAVYRMANDRFYKESLPVEERDESAKGL